MNLSFVTDGVLDFVSHDFNVLEQHHGLQRAQLEGFHGVFHSEHNHSRIEGNGFEEFADNLFLLQELDRAESVSGESNSLVEAVFEAVVDIKRCEHDVG